MAKDLFQEVALRFCRSADCIDHNKPIFPWLMTVIRNTCCDLYRRSYQLVSLNVLPEYIEACYSNKAELEIRENRRVRFIRRQLDDLMEDLSVAEKLAVEYSCIGGFKVDEASAFCGTDRLTFFKRKSAALRKMRDKKDCYMSMLKKNGSSTLDLEDLLTHASEFS